MIKSHKRLTASLLVSAVLVAGLGVFNPKTVSADSNSSNSVMTVSTVQTAIIKSSVRLRSKPSTNGTVVKYLKKDERVTVLEKTNKYWYQVRTANGNIGYTSSNVQYISLVGNTGVTTPTLAPPASQPEASTQIERVISAGMKYLGTPYEYGSSRNNTSTFDCSDFIRQMFLDAANLKLPADSRQQGDWVKQNSEVVVTNTAGLKRGDLMFFMAYKGNSASAYAGINKANARITHVAMYLGDGQILHTYSTASGGVKVDKLSTSWMNRFLYGGSVIR